MPTTPINYYLFKLNKITDLIRFPLQINLDHFIKKYSTHSRNYKKTLHKKYRGQYLLINPEKLWLSPTLQQISLSTCTPTHIDSLPDSLDIENVGKECFGPQWCNYFGNILFISEKNYTNKVTNELAQQRRNQLIKTSAYL